jgi:hypothetical protein
MLAPSTSERTVSQGSVETAKSTNPTIQDIVHFYRAVFSVSDFQGSKFAELGLKMAHCKIRFQRGRLIRPCRMPPESVYFVRVHSANNYQFLYDQ